MKRRPVRRGRSGRRVTTLDHPATRDTATAVAIAPTPTTTQSRAAGPSGSSEIALRSPSGERADPDSAPMAAILSAAPSTRPPGRSQHRHTAAALSDRLDQITGVPTPLLMGSACASRVSRVWASVRCRPAALGTAAVLVACVAGVARATVTPPPLTPALISYWTAVAKCETGAGGPPKWDWGSRHRANEGDALRGRCRLQHADVEALGRRARPARAVPGCL